MAQEPVTKANSDVDPVMKKLRYLNEQIKDVKQSQAEIKNDIAQLKNAQGYSQPSDKIKVCKTETDIDGNLQTIPADDVVKEVYTRLEKRGALETKQVRNSVENYGYERSTKQVHRMMERMADVWDHLELQRASDRHKARSNRLVNKKKVDL